MAAERIEHILDAYTRCVARFGLEGTTLQQVANEAGMARGHVRHYVGNREELRRLFGKRMVARYSDRAAAASTELPVGRKAEGLVRYFFRDDLEINDDYAAIDALMAASRHDGRLRKRMCAVYTGLESLIATAIASDYPNHLPAVYEDAAYQILSLAYGHWTFQEVGFPHARTASARRMALAILKRIAAAPVALQEHDHSP